MSLVTESAGDSQEGVGGKQGVSDQRPKPMPSFGLVSVLGQKVKKEYILERWIYKIDGVLTDSKCCWGHKDWK